MPRRRRLPNFLRQAEANRLLAIAQAQLERAKTPAKRRAATLDILLINSGTLLGLRVSELCKLQIEHLDLAQATAARIPGQGRPR